MSNHLPVASLKLGDRFEFLTTQTEGSTPTVLVVTRSPAVNSIADSCQFRYRTDTAADGSARKWDENQSWNGTLNVLVRIVERAPQPAAGAVTPTAPAPVMPAPTVPARTGPKPTASAPATPAPTEAASKAETRAVAAPTTEAEEAVTASAPKKSRRAKVSVRSSQKKVPQQKVRRKAAPQKRLKTTKQKARKK